MHVNTAYYTLTWHQCGFGATYCMFLPYKIGHFVIVLYATKCDGECFHMIPLGENYFHFGLSTHSIIDLAALAQNARFRLLTARALRKWYLSEGSFHYFGPVYITTASASTFILLCSFTERGN